MELVKKFNKKYRFIEPSILKRINEIVESPVLSLINEIPPLGVGVIVELRFGDTMINTRVQSINIISNIDNYTYFGVHHYHNNREQNLTMEITFIDKEHLNTIFNNIGDIYRLRVHQITNGVISNTIHMSITGGEIEIYQDTFVVSFDGRYEN